MMVDMIRKTHPKAISNTSLGMMISAMELVLVLEHLSAETRDILTTKWMSDKSRAVKTIQVTYVLVNRPVVFSSSFKGGIKPAPTSI
jgi:hypothetical protein